MFLHPVSLDESVKVQLNNIYSHVNLLFAAGSLENVTGAGLSNSCCSLTLSRGAAAAEDGCSKWSWDISGSSLGGYLIPEKIYLD